MSRKAADRLAELEQMIRDLEPASAEWQQAAAEYVRLKNQQRTSENGVVSDKQPVAYVPEPAPWEVYIY